MNCEKTLKCIEFVLGASKVGIDIIDSRFNIRYIDPAWKKLYGDPAGKKCYQYFMDRKSMCPHCGIVEALRTKKLAVSEEVMIKEHDKPVRVTTVPFQDEDGEWLVAETNVDISDMKRTEDALRASQEEFEAIAERSVVGIVMAQGSRITYANESFARIFGYKAEELIGAEVMRLVARSDRKMFAAKIQNRLRGAKGISQYEMLGIRKGGTEVAVEVGTGPVVAVNGVPTLIITVQDISERKRMERDLRSSENRYRQLFEENYDAIFVAEPKKGVIVDCNKKAEELIGFSRKKILSMRAIQLHPVPIRRKVLSVFNKMARGMKTTVELEILTNDKRRIPVSVSGMSLQIDGKLRVVGIFKDISESRRSAEAVRQSEELYRMLSELAQEAIYILDLRGRFTYMNTYAARFVGKKPADVVGRSMAELFDNRMGLIEKKDAQKIVRTGKSFSVTVRIGNYWMDTHLSPIKDAKGNITAIMGVSRDITLYKNAEEVLKRDREGLEREIKKRSEELLKANEELNKVKRLSDIGLLAATVAHELRSPLAAIRTATYNIRKKSGDPLLESNLGNIDKKVVESDRIINNLLAYSSIKVPQIEKVDLSQIVDECMGFLKDVFRERNVSVQATYECKKTDCVIEADPVQIREVFSNILNNAFEAIPLGSGKVTIHIRAKDKNAIQITFEDNGEGISEDHLKRVFEPFFSTKTKGTGLGLAVCYQIIKLHNGTITIESKVRKGTTVVIILPRKKTPGRVV